MHCATQHRGRDDGERCADVEPARAVLDSVKTKASCAHIVRRCLLDARRGETERLRSPRTSHASARLAPVAPRRSAAKTGARLAVYHENSVDAAAGLTPVDPVAGLPQCFARKCVATYDLHALYPWLNRFAVRKPRRMSDSSAGVGRRCGDASLTGVR